MKANVDLNLLRCFEAMLAEQNVSRAARLVGLTQPSMSHALNRLRRLFDDPLFINAHGAMAPTARARDLQPRVREVLAHAEALLDGPSRFDPPRSTLALTLMAAEYVEFLLLPRLLDRLRTEAPGVKLMFQSADRDRAFERLERGDVDFRLAWWPEPAGTLHSKELFRDAFVCVARKGHPAVVRGSIAENSFVETPHAVIQPARSGIAYQSVVTAFARRSRRLNVALQAQNAQSLCNAVCSSDLLASLPERFALRMAAQFPLVVVRPPFPLGEARQSIYWHERSHKLASHRWFRALACEVAAEL